MTRQIAMDFEAGIRAQEVVAKVDHAVANLVDGIRAKEAAYVLGILPATLHKKLEREDRHQLSLRDAVILLVTAPEMHRKEVLDVLAEACGFQVAKAPELSPAEVLKRVEAALDDYLAPAAKAEVFKRARGVR